MRNFVTMREFVESFVVPLLTGRKSACVCEIGASSGASTSLLASLPNVTVTVVDPCLDCDLKKKYAGSPQVTVKRGISLEVLPSLQDSFDCILVDGDHNWYTVYHELKLISERHLLQPGGLIFFHDVEWPYGRRDMYYQPEMIPRTHRHSYDQKGIVRGQSELSDRSGFNSALCNAAHEGGAHNGVLTAIEDFLHDRRVNRDYRLYCVREGYGLGVMQRSGKLKDDLIFLSLQCKGTSYHIAHWSKRFIKLHFPRAFSMAKSLLGRT